MALGETLIAVLDDEAEMRKALRRLLTCRGFRVQELERAEDFLAASEPNLPDCLLLDLQMPGLNGFQLLEILAARKVRIPVVVITAHDEPGTAEQVRALGAFAYLRKPIDREALFAALGSALAQVPERKCRK